MQAFSGRGFELNYVKLSQVRLNRIRFSRNEPKFALDVFYCLDFEVFFRLKMHLAAINRQVFFTHILKILKNIWNHIKSYRGPLSV